MSQNNISYERMQRMRPLGLTQQQWFALVGALTTIHRHPRVKMLNILSPIRKRVRKTGQYTNTNRNALLAWARSL